MTVVGRFHGCNEIVAIPRRGFVVAQFGKYVTLHIEYNGSYAYGISHDFGSVGRYGCPQITFHFVAVRT